METKKQTIREISVFLAITTIITAGLFIWFFNSPEVNMGMTFIMMWTPGIAAILTSIFFKEKIRNYGWKLGKAKYLGMAYILPIVAALIGYGLVWMTDIADVSFEVAKTYKWATMLGLELPVPAIVGLLAKIFIGTILFTIFILGEEIGWSGFLTPKLLKVTSIPVASVIVGVYWSLWHYPAIINGDYGYGIPLWIALPSFTVVMTAASLIRTVLVKKSGNLWTGTVVHLSHNMFLMGIFYDITVQHKDYTSSLVSETGIFLGVVYLVVAIVLVVRQKK